MMARLRGYDPYSAIPSADLLRRRLAELQEQSRRMKILLRTAEAIDREQAQAEAKDVGQGGTHDAK